MSRYYYFYRLLFVIAISILLFVSCKKSMQDDTKPFGGTKVTFTVAGVNSENNRDKSATSKNVSLNEVVKTSSLSTGAVPKNVSLEVLGKV